MPDVFSKEKRSWVMSRIRGSNTGPELKLRRLLWAAGLQCYRVKNQLPGKPDVVFRAARLVVFVDGCFWHRCPKDFIQPKTKQSFWTQKIAANVKRDAVVNRRLRKEGWSIIRIWEHELRKSPDNAVARISRRVRRTC